MFHFKNFQREDIGRLACHDGVVCGMATGTGKTLVLFVWPAIKLGFVGDETPADRERSPVRSTSEPAPISGSPSHQSINPPIHQSEPLGLKPKGSVLLVVPEDGHDQTEAEGRLHFKARCTRIDSQERFLQLSRLDPTGRRLLPPGYYITSYTQLSLNGVQPFPTLEAVLSTSSACAFLVPDSDLEEFFSNRSTIYAHFYQRLNAGRGETLQEVRAQYFSLRKVASEALRPAIDEAWHTLEKLAPQRRPHGDPGLWSIHCLSPGQRAWLRHEVTRRLYLQYQENVGASRHYPWGKVKCVYSPSLADLCQDSFGAVAADEGTRIQGEDTIIGTGLRQLNPRFRLITTATPIKNRLPSVFRLAWWAAGAQEKPHARFPYGDDSAQRDDFASEFLISERNLSKEEETNRRYVRLTPQVCNLHRLWKLFAPLVLRRRKEDTGEPIVAKIRHVIRTPMGTDQAKVYEYHLKAPYKDRNQRPAVGAKLQALRIATANPCSDLLKPVANYNPVPESSSAVSRQSINPPIHRSHSRYIPKLAAALNLLHQILQKGEQALVFSSFYSSLDELSDRLHQASVPHLVLDGRMSPAKRGRAAALFKGGPPAERERSPVRSGSACSHQSTNPLIQPSRYPVALAGVECMAELHSFHLVRNVILMAYSWAYDKFEQGINRVHRLNSPQDVHIWSILCEDSIDPKLESNIAEKSDACELVLDGRLLGEQSAELDLNELLHTARTSFNPATTRTIDERVLELEWPALRSNLAAAAKNWALVAGPVGPMPSSGFPCPPSTTATPPPPPQSAIPDPQSAMDDLYSDLPLWRLLDAA